MSFSLEASILLGYILAMMKMTFGIFFVPGDFKSPVFYYLDFKSS